jgi:two-component system, NtrC family, response regulator AtoC
MMPAPSVLIADDDPVARDLLAEVLAKEGYLVRSAGGGSEALDIARQVPIDLAFIDLRMPDVDGLAVLRGLHGVRPGTPVIILTAFATIETAMEAIHAGAYDYLSKPFQLELIRLRARRALEEQRLRSENLRYRQELQTRFAAKHVVGTSPSMVEVYRLAARVASADTAVLIVGETGTGKELIARAIHVGSPRADRPFVPVDCTALPEPLVESELFGHERGAFTGAVATRRGLFEAAAGGTIFLDEVGELPAALQPKLLRVLQEREIRRVGGTEQVPVDVRVIAATHRDLRNRVTAGELREDLYFRLNVLTIHLPPLRQRVADIPLLAHHFVEKYSAARQRPAPALSPEALARLAAYPWPGNVRELENVVERAVTLVSGPVLLAEDLALEPLPPAAAGPALPGPRMSLEEVKQWYVHRVLEEAGGNKQRAAELLGVDRRTLYRLLARLTEEET